jgi:hypothetical protein
MEGILAFFVNLLFSNQETYNLNEGVLIVVLISLLTALTISIIVAKKNNLFSKSGGYEDPLGETDQLQ